MQSIFDPVVERDLIRRIQRLTPESQGQWGKLTAPAMVCHLIDALRVPLRDDPVTVRPGLMTNPMIRHILIFWMPWPKGRIQTVKKYFMVTKATEFSADVATLCGCVRAAAAAGREERAFQPHPAFGDLSRRQWGGLMAKHASYHLTQFGV